MSNLARAYLATRWTTLIKNQHPLHIALAATFTTGQGLFLFPPWLLPDAHHLVLQLTQLLALPRTAQYTVMPDLDKAQDGQRAFKSIQKVGEIGHFAACAVQELVLSSLLGPLFLLS